jgi:hypothetical protein
MAVVMAGCWAWVSELAAGAENAEKENEETTKVERPTFPDGRLLWHTMTPETFFLIQKPTTVKERQMTCFGFDS